jgi:hypothetical protein
MELFRHDVDRWGAVEDRAAQQLAFTDDAVRLAATRSVAEFLAAREQHQPPARYVVTHGLFGASSSVVCVTEFPPNLTNDGQHVVVRAAGKEITFMARALPALALLLSGEPVDIATATRATGVDAAVLADVLVAEGIFAEATPELAAGYAGLLMAEDR